MYHPGKSNFLEKFVLLQSTFILKVHMTELIQIDVLVLQKVKSLIPKLLKLLLSFTIRLFKFLGNLKSKSPK